MRVQQQAELLEAVSPNAVLQRGFAVVRNARGQVVHDANGLRSGQKLNVQFAHDSVDVWVADKQKQGDLFKNLYS